MRRAAPLLALLVLVGCSRPTELMLVVKAGSGLTIGTGGQIDQIRVRAQPANDPPTTFFFDKYVTLCTIEGPGCRPTEYATEDYDGSLTLPIHFLLQPGDKGIDDDIRVWVDGLSNNNVVLASGLRFQFSKGHRLWLELPLFPQCLGKLTCEEEDLACGSDTDCVAYVPTKSDSSDDAGQSPTADLSGDDLSSNADFSEAPLDLATRFYDLAALCGHDGEPCCATGAQCVDSGLVCDQPTTVCKNTSSKCGEIMEGCCPVDGGESSCNSKALYCEPDGNTCVSCGAPGQPCCAGQCNGGASCNSTSQMCEPCGGSGMQCCNTGTQCNNTSLTCTDGTCVTTCGASGQPCCAGNMCNGNIQCNITTKMCGNCGPPKAHGLGQCAQ